jgi:hypothetical protein
MKGKAEAVIAALLTEPSHAKAAEKAGISESTLLRWLRKPAFLRVYRRVRRGILEAAIGRLQKAADRAVDALERNLTCDHPPSEIRAATAILEHAGRGLELLDLRERLEELERLLTDKNPKEQSEHEFA